MLTPINDNRAINKKLPVNFDAGPKFDVAFSKLVLPFCVAGTVCALAAVAQKKCDACDRYDFIHRIFFLVKLQHV